MIQFMFNIISLYHIRFQKSTYRFWGKYLAYIDCFENFYTSLITEINGENKEKCFSINKYLGVKMSYEMHLAWPF